MDKISFDFPAIIEKSGISAETLTNAEKVELAEYLLLSNVEAAVENAKALQVTHHLLNGLYAREIFLPAGTLLTGKIHNFDHLSVLSAGDVSVMTDDGIVRIKAPFTWPSKAGTKRLIYVHSDTIWTTFHITATTDVDSLESELVHDSDLSWVDDKMRLTQ